MNGKTVIVCLLLLTANLSANAQSDTSQLYKELKACDSLLFDVGYNTCNIARFEALLSDSFEFYHDETGITPTKAGFINGVENGLCKLYYKPRRELVAGSLAVFPMMKNGVLYGAVQSGRHNFYALEPGKPEYFTSTALFTNLWLLEGGKWKLYRSISYAHQQH